MNNIQVQSMYENIDMAESLLRNYYESIGYPAVLHVIKREAEGRFNDLATVFGSSNSQFRKSEFTEEKVIYLLVGRNELALIGNRSSVNIPIYSPCLIDKGAKITIKFQNDIITYHVSEDPQISTNMVYYCNLDSFTSYSDEGAPNV